jgi:hypothetical protein
MSTDTLRTLAQRFADDIINARDLDGALTELVVEDFVEQNPLPGQGPGRAGLAGVLAGMFAAFPDLRWTLLDTVTERANQGPTRGVNRGGRRRGGSMPAGDQQQGGEDERVRLLDPLRVAGRRIQILDDRRDRDVDDSRVQDDHGDAQADHQQAPPAAPAVLLRRHAFLYTGSAGMRPTPPRRRSASGLLDRKTAITATTWW